MSQEIPPKSQFGETSIITPEQLYEAIEEINYEIEEKGKSFSKRDILDRVTGILTFAESSTLDSTKFSQQLNIKLKELPEVAEHENIRATVREVTKRIRDKKKQSTPAQNGEVIAKTKDPVIKYEEKKETPILSSESNQLVNHQLEALSFLDEEPVESRIEKRINGIPLEEALFALKNLSKDYHSNRLHITILSQKDTPSVLSESEKAIRIKQFDRCIALIDTKIEELATAKSIDTAETKKSTNEPVLNKEILNTNLTNQLEVATVTEKEIDLKLKEKEVERLAKSDTKNFKAELNSKTRKADRDSGIKRDDPKLEKVVILDNKTPEGQSITWIQNHKFTTAIKEAGTDISKLESIIAGYELQQPILLASSHPDKNKFIKICNFRIDIIHQAIKDIKEENKKAPEGKPTPEDKKEEVTQGKEQKEESKEAIIFDENIKSFDDLVTEINKVSTIPEFTSEKSSTEVIQAINQLVHHLTTSTLKSEHFYTGDKETANYHDLLKQFTRRNGLRKTIERLVREHLDSQEAKQKTDRTKETPKEPEQITRESIKFTDGTLIDTPVFFKEVTSYDELVATGKTIEQIVTPTKVYELSEIEAEVQSHLEAIEKNPQYDIVNAIKDIPKVGGLRHAVKRILIEASLRQQAKPTDKAEQEKELPKITVEELKSDKYFNYLLSETNTKEDIENLKKIVVHLLDPQDPLYIERMKAIVTEDRRLVRDIMFATSVRKLGLDREELDANPEFTALSAEQQLLALRNLEQVVLEHVKEESITRFEDSLKDKGWLKKAWRGIRKDFLIAENEKAVINEASQNALKVVSKERFSEIIKSSGSLPVEITEGGKIQVSYSNQFHHLTTEEMLQVNTFNEVANIFAQIPQEWRYETATKAQQKEYADAKTLFENYLVRLTDLKKKEIELEAQTKDKTDTPKEPTVALQEYINEIQANVSIQQFLQTHPDAQEEIDRLAHSSSAMRGLKTLADDKKLPFLVGFGIRSAAPGAALVGGISSIAAITAPLAGAVVGAIVANRKVNEQYRKQELKGRKGDTLRVEVTTKLSRVNGEIKRLEVSGPLTKEDQEKLDSYVNEKSELEQQLLQINPLEKTAKNLAPATFLSNKITLLVDRYNSTGNEIERARILQSLKVRVDYTQLKAEAGLVSYGKDSIGLVNQVSLTQAIFAGQALLEAEAGQAEELIKYIYTSITGKEEEVDRASFFNEEGKPKEQGERIQDNVANMATWNANRERYLREDLNHLLSSKDTKVKKARLAHKARKIGEGMAMGAGFGAAGYWLRHFGEIGWHSDLRQNTTSKISEIWEKGDAKMTSSTTPIESTKGTPSVQSVKTQTPSTIIPSEATKTPKVAIPKIKPDEIVESGTDRTLNLRLEPEETSLPKDKLQQIAETPLTENVADAGTETPIETIEAQKPAATIEIVDKKVRGKMIYGNQEQVLKNHLIAKGIPQKDAEGLAHRFIEEVAPEEGKKIVHAGDKIQIFEDENGITEIKVIPKGETVIAEPVASEPGFKKDTIEDYKYHRRTVRDSAEHSVLQLIKKNPQYFGYDADDKLTPSKWAKARVDEFFSKPENKYLRTAITHDGNEVAVGQNADGSLIVKIEKGSGRTPTFVNEGQSEIKEIPETPTKKTPIETPPEPTKTSEVKIETPQKSSEVVQVSEPIEEVTQEKKLTPKQIIEREKFFHKKLPLDEKGDLIVSKLSTTDKRIYNELLNETTNGVPLPSNEPIVEEIPVLEYKPIVEDIPDDKNIQYIDVPNTPNEPLNIKGNFHPAYDLNLVSTQGEFNETAYKEMLSINPRLKGIYDGIERANQLFLDEKGRHWIQGRTTIFGGGKDELGRPGEITAISGESFAGLNPNKQFYISARWPYNHIPKSVLKDSIVEIRCPRTGKIAYAYPNEWGPSPIAVVKSARSGRYVLDLGKDGRTPNYWHRSFDTSKAVLNKLAANDKEVLQIRLLRKGNLAINSQGNLVEKITKVVRNAKLR